MMPIKQNHRFKNTHVFYCLNSHRDNGISVQLQHFYIIVFLAAHFLGKFAKNLQKICKNSKQYENGAMEPKGQFVTFSKAMKPISSKM